MRIAYIGAGAAGMYCGSCLHDNALAAALLARGHEVALLPTYTPIRTDEEDVSVGQIFYGAVNVYLRERLPLLARAPRAFRRLLDRPSVLRWVSRLAASTEPSALGALTLSVLRGEEGAQRPELERLAEWLAAFRPQVIHLTNSLFLGLARELKRAAGAPLVCGLSGEDLFLDGLVEPYRARCLAELRRHAADADAFVATSRFYAVRMAVYLGIEAAAIEVVPLGIQLDGYGEPASERAPEAALLDGSPGSAASLERASRVPLARSAPFTIGYLARIAPEKGLHVLIDAFRILAGEVGHDRVRLRVAGYLGLDRRSYLAGIRERLAEWRLDGGVEFLGELYRPGKLAFLRGLDVLSVPATFEEPRGRYVLEALASGVPVVEPRHGAFPELIESTGGGHLVEPGSAEGLAAGLRRLMEDPLLRRELGERGRRAVHARHGAGAMADATLALYQRLVASRSGLVSGG